jgi:hemerythrin
MAFLSWHARYLIGHAEVDAQHRKLFELVNHFGDVVQMDMPEELGRILDDILICSIDHFRFEEEVMEELRYPGLLEHKRQHQELVQQLQQRGVQMMAGGHLSTRSFTRFLVDWLANHILREDMMLRPYLKS